MFLEDSEIIGNTGNVLSTTTGSGLYVNALWKGTISKNQITSNVNQNGHKTMYLNYIYYSNVEGNHIWANDDSVLSVEILNLYESTFSGNFIRGKYSIISVTNSEMNNNNFRSLGAWVNGWTLSSQWSFKNGNITFYSNAFPPALDWNKGDKCINNDPNTGEYEGWVCVQSGVASDQTWKGYGLIA